MQQRHEGDHSTSSVQPHTVSSCTSTPTVHHHGVHFTLTDLCIYLFNLEVCTSSRVRVMTGLRCGNVRSLTHVLYRHLSARKPAKSSDQGGQCNVICRVLMRSLTACAMPHVVSRRFLNAVVSLRYQTSPCDICRGHNVTRTGFFFFPSTSVFPLSV